MIETLTIIGSVAGGLGLFLLAVTLITDGLKFAAGDALSDMLGRWTKTPERGIASGIIITGLVQSSSAVTVATIGFVNAGILSMSQALGVVFGANVGTTMTGWLVAAVGFEFKVEAFALPLIGLGMLLSLIGAKKRYGAIIQRGHRHRAHRCHRRCRQSFCRRCYGDRSQCGHYLHRRFFRHWCNAECQACCQRAYYFQPYHWRCGADIIADTAVAGGCRG